MKPACVALLTLLLAAVPRLALGDPPADETPAPQDAAPADFGMLPEPLNEISGNMTEFEKSGHFTIAGVRVGPAGSYKENAIVWTLRANRSMTFRHVEVLLRNFQEVRFYARGKNAGRHVYMTLLAQSGGIVADAINGEVLPEGNEIEVWIHLDGVQIGRILGAKADVVEFRRLRR